MAGKPEHSITHPAPPNHIHQQLYHHHHHQQSHNFQNHQNNRRTHHISHNDSQELQQNSVLVYVPNENFSYTTVDEQNAGANYQTSQHQQANNYQVATELFNKSGYRAGISDLQNEVDCCLDKSIELINRQNDTHQDEEDNYSQNYRSNSVNLSIGRATGSPINSGKIDLGVFSSSGSLGSARSPSQSDAESLSSASDSGVVATAIAATRSALPSSAIIVSECEEKNHFASYEVPCYTSGINYVRNNSSNSIRISQEGSEGCRRENSGSERRCDSVRSDTGESAYSSNLSSPECQSVVQGSDAILANCGGVVVQQAAHLVTQVNVGNSNNGVLNMNGSEVTQQTHQQQAAIAAPRGWKRICTNGVIIYISPSSTALGSLDQLKEYLTTAGTCKCGLECPLRPEQVFNFDPKVATRPWSPDQGETREMTKLCNHKRKLLLPAAAASPVASCTPVVSSSVLPTQGTLGTIHPCAESPTPSDKTKKDGLSKKKKRKLGSVGNVYSGVSVSQLLAQRERAIAVAGTTGVQGLPASNGSQVWPITALPLQQNSQQIGHQSINSPMQNLEVNNCAVRNSQQRLNPHNMTSMLMGNPLIMNQQGTNFNNMNQYHMNQYQSQPQNQSIYNQQTQQMQILHHDQQPQNQHHQNVISNQLTHQQTSHYVNQMNENSVHNMQQQNHMNQQQQIHLQAMQKHSQAQHGHNNQDPCQQQMQNYNNTHHTNDGFVHHSSQNSLHPSMHQFHQHSMPHQQSSNSHMMQTQGPDPFQMQNSHQMQQYNNQNMNHHVDIVQQSNGQIISGMNPSDVQMRHNRNHTMNDEEINAKQMAQHQHQQQILMHNHNMERHHPQSENLQNLNHENMQRMYNNHQVQFQRNCELNKNGNMDAKNVHQQYMLVSQAGRSPNNGNVIEVQSIMGSVQNGNPNNLHSNQRTQMWQQQNNRSIAPSHPSPTIPVSIQNISCNSMDRVPPLHHHIPQAASWPDEVARKKSKPSKSLAKKQRHHNIPEKTIRNNNIEELSASPRNEFEKLNSNNQIGSTVSNSSPSFLDDPSGYLAQQTALLNSTISRQTGVTSSQMMIVNTKNQQGHNENHLGNNNYVPQHQKPTSSVKNHATSPVVVHSSMTPTSVGSNTNDSDSADTQSYIQDQYHNKTINRQFMINGDQDPVTSSTFGERFVMDSRPIQGGTISTSHGSPIGTNSPTNNPDNSNSCISQPTTPQSLISSQPSTPHSYSQPPTPHSSQIPPQSLTPVSQAPSQSSNNQIHDQIITSASSTISPSTSPTENLSPTISKKSRRTPEGYQPHPHTINSVQKPSIMNYSGNSTVITTMASGHTFSSNTITSVLAGKANTATVSINKPSGIPNPAIPNIISTKSSQGNTIVTTGVLNRTNSSPIQTQTTIVTKSPLEMVQSVVSSIQVPQTSSTISQQQQNVQVHNVLTSSGVLKHSTASGLPPGHILVSSGGQLIMASTGNGIGGVMAPPPPKIISNSNSMPPLSVSPMVTSVTGAVSQVIPAVGVAQQVNLQPTVLVNTIQTPVLIQPSVMTMDGIGQNVQIPHLTVATGNVIQNAQSILDANQDVTRTVNTNSRLLSPESNSMTKKKVYKKRKNHTQTVASMLHIASSQQNTGMLMQSQSNFTQQNFQAPMLQALTIVPGKGGAPAQLVMNGQTSATNQFNTQQIITNQQPTQQINLLQPVNLLNGTTGMMQNFPTIQQFIVPGLGSMVMSADGTATLLQDTTGNLGMQLQIQNVNGQNVLTPVQSHSGIFGQSQSILAAGPAGMVIRAPQQTSGKLIQQHSPGAQFLSPNSGQFLVNGTTSFGNQLSPIVANVSPNQQVTFNTSQVRPSNIQGQQEFIQMNGQTLMVPCATAQNLAVSSSSNQQNTTFVQQNTTIVQQQTTMVSNNQIPDFQTVAGSNGNVDQSLNLDHNHQSYILSASGMIQGKSPTSPKNLRINSPGSDNSGDNQQNNSTQQFILTGNGGNGNSRGLIISDKNGQQSGEISPNMVRHSVSTQTAGNQANMGQSALMRQGSPPDTTTHSPGNSQRSNSPAVDTTTHGAASPAPPMTSRHHSSSTPMVHCISSSEPDSGDLQASTDDWQNHGITTKEITLNQPGLNGKTYVESTVTTGIQVGNHVEQGTFITQINMHQSADTTHPENKIDSQGHMDTSSPIHLNSDTTDLSTMEDHLRTNNNNTNSLNNFLPGHYSSTIHQNNYVVHNHNSHRQHSLVADHADYTILPGHKIPNSFSNHDRPTNGVQLQLNEFRNENRHSNREKSTVNLLSGVTNQKLINFDISKNLYPHLYDSKSCTDSGITFINYQTNNDQIVNQLFEDSFTSDDVQSGDETDDSSDED